MIKTLIVVLGCSILGFWGTLAVLNRSLFFPNDNSISSPTVSSTPIISPPPFILRPPSAGIIGTVSSTEGEVKIGKRDDTEPVEATQGADLVDGDTIFTDEGTAQITFPNLCDLQVDSRSQVTIVNALANTFLLHQIAGTVLYRTQHPVSVRTAGTVIHINGDVTITPREDEGIIDIITQKGTAKISWVTNTNQTQVEEIPQNSTALFDGAIDEVIIE